MAGLALQGEALLQKLEQLLDKNISLVVATSSRSLAKNSTDLQVLAARGRCLSGLGPWAWGEAWHLTCWRHGTRKEHRAAWDRPGKATRAPLVHQEGRAHRGPGWHA